MEPDILFEDSDALVINKPTGLMVHEGKSKIKNQKSKIERKDNTEESTLVDWLIKKYPDIKDVGEVPALDATRSTLHAPRPGIVHRLDRETSGAMVIAKNQETYLYLKRQFQDREVKKKYHAFVTGEMKSERGTIDKPIGRSPRDFRQWSAGRGAKGELRDAVTWFRVVARGKGCSFVEAQPRTGRTHQIRAHFKAIGHPVIGDKLYAPKEANALGFSRTALHARSLAFKLRGGKEISVTAPYPPDFKKAMTELGVDAK